MIAGTVTDPLDFIDPAFSLDQLRRLQGGLQIRLAELHVERQSAQTLRDKLDAAQLVEVYTEAVDKCRRVIRAKLSRAGWPEYRRPPGPSTRRSPSPRPTYLHSAMPRRASAGHVAGRLGVAGAMPPPVMGHGWPAVSGAGSAATGSDRSDYAPPCPSAEPPP